MAKGASKSLLKGAKESATGAIKDTAKGAVQGAKDTATGAIQGAKDTATGAVQGAKDKVASATDKVPVGTDKVAPATAKAPPPVATANGASNNEGESLESSLALSKTDQLMVGFDIMYIIFGVIGALMVVLVFILMSVDGIKFASSSASQYFVQFISPNLYTKDTLDYSTLMYYKNSLDEEPYSIFLQQKIIGKMFNLVQYFFITVFAQIAVHLVLSIWYKNKGIRYNPVFKFDRIKMVASVMVVVLICAVTMNIYYNKSFLGSLQPTLATTTQSMEETKNMIYDNITTNDTFLKALVNNDILTLVNTINAQTNLSVVSRMIFTMSLYNFFKINISENQEEFNTVIKKIFTPQQIRVREINPMDYMYYGQNVFIPNLYPIVKEYITSPTGSLNTASKEFKVRTDVSTRINNVNTLLMTLFKLPTKRASFRNYIGIAWTLGFLFTLMIAMLYKKQVSALYYNVMVPVWNSIKAMLSRKASLSPSSLPVPIPTIVKS